MIYVLDASVVVDLLLLRKPYCIEIESLIRNAEVLTAPYLLDLEVTQVLRRFLLRGELSQHRADQAMSDLLGLPLQRYSHEQLIVRAFKLANNFTMYDVTYVILAEALDATLLTRDKAMKAVPDTAIRVKIIGE